MDRIIVYPGAIPLDTDLLNTNRNTMTALSGLLAATLGASPGVPGWTPGYGVLAIDGFQTTPGTGLTVSVGQGTVTVYGTEDTTSYGSLPSVSTQVYKMYQSLGPTVLSVPAPGTGGTSINYLIEVQIVEQDTTSVVLPYYNPSNPALQYLGPANSGTGQNTLRAQKCNLQVKAGVAAVTGTQVTPAPDSGWIGLATVTVANGAASIVQGNITNYPNPFYRSVPFKLPDLAPGYAYKTAFTTPGTGSFTWPTWVTRAKVTMWGGGGGGGGAIGTSGTNSSVGGGGGSGGKLTVWCTGITGGATLSYTVGAPGSGGAVGSNGTAGGTTSFGGFGSVGGGGPGLTNSLGAGANGGAGCSTFTASAGTYIFEGGDSGATGLSFFTASGVAILAGGNGGAPGGCGGTSAGTSGVPATGPGGGGGGGATAGSGGQTGGAGGPGMILVEY